MDIDINSSYSRTIDPDMALSTAEARTSPWPYVAARASQISMSPSSSVALRHLHGLVWHPGQLTTVWLLVVTWASYFSTDPICGRTMDQDGPTTWMALGGSMGPHIIMAPGGCTSSLYPLVYFSPQCTSCSALLSPPSFHYTLISLLSITYSLIIVLPGT